MEPGFCQDCLFAALRAAKAAGDAILTVYHGEFDVEYKEDRSPLTVADRRAHSVIKEHLAGDDRLEGIPLLSEEGRSIPYEVRSRWDHFWLVDPLDGTKEFVKRLDEFTVNNALIQAGKPIKTLHDKDKSIVLYNSLLTGDNFHHSIQSIAGPIKRKQNQAALMTLDLLRRYLQHKAIDRGY